MLFNTTHVNKEYDQESLRQLGKAYSFIERLKMGGIGSSRLVIHELCPDFKPKHQEKIADSYSNIELRPKGIIVHFANRLERFSWLIPYPQLNMESTEIFSIHSDEKYISYKKNKNYKGNEKFLSKMMDLKNSYSKQGT